MSSPSRAPIVWEVNNPNAQRDPDPSLGNPNANNDFYLYADFRARADFPNFPDFYPFNDFDRGTGVKNDTALQSTRHNAIEFEPICGYERPQRSPNNNRRPTSS